MGLGKTLQTLAHILAEKAAGRLTAPALVVCPTSLVANWRHEAARFAPELRVLTLHGADRATSASRQIAGADWCSRPTRCCRATPRRCCRAAWHMVVLDEAQAIKNPASKAAQTACRLKAGHRLCLTGTPIENHLGELWSMFNFLMPGLLGDREPFGRMFRTPIEKRGRRRRAATLLAAPHPAVHAAPHQGAGRARAAAQDRGPAPSRARRATSATSTRRVRLAMHERGPRRRSPAGLARSQIVILDALLKLRQVCCDPRLVKLGGGRARAAAPSSTAHGDAARA